MVYTRPMHREMKLPESHAHHSSADKFAYIGDYRTCTRPECWLWIVHSQPKRKDRKKKRTDDQRVRCRHGIFCKPGTVYKCANLHTLSASGFTVINVVKVLLLNWCDSVVFLCQREDGTRRTFRQWRSWWLAGPDRRRVIANSLYIVWHNHPCSQLLSVHSCTT